MPGSYWVSHNGAPGTSTHGRKQSATLQRTRISGQEVLEGRVPGRMGQAPRFTTLRREELSAHLLHSGPSSEPCKEKLSMKEQWRPRGYSREYTFSRQQQPLMMCVRKGLRTLRCFLSTSCSPIWKNSPLRVKSEVPWAWRAAGCWWCLTRSRPDLKAGTSWFVDAAVCIWILFSISCLTDYSLFFPAWKIRASRWFSFRVFHNSCWYQLEALFWCRNQARASRDLFTAKRHSIYGGLQVLQVWGSSGVERLLFSWLHCLSNCSFKGTISVQEIFFSWTVTRRSHSGLPKELRSVTCFFFIGLPKIMPYYFNSYCACSVWWIQGSDSEKNRIKLYLLSFAKAIRDKIFFNKVIECSCVLK